MSAIVGSLEFFSRDVRVDLRGGKAGVPEQRLYASEIGSVIEEVRGKGVAQFVRAHGGWEPCATKMFFHH